ncbi:MAG: Holliday junction branch migration DNA helicase RuvB [Clostridia bacterium]|nr:Holliday junction branch migration DNA helicase RuvB [Clostridia bacterium]
MDERVTSPETAANDFGLDHDLRPHSLSEYVGQENIKDNLAVFMEAAMQRKEALDHVLLYGPPGLGKTTLAGIIANTMQVQLRVTSGPAIEKPGDLAAILSGLSEHDVLFIDEIHRLSRAVEEVLYSAMEDYALDIVLGKGMGAQTLRVNLPHFTLIGATTKAGMVSAPLRSRFGMVMRLELYTPEELAQIVTRSAGILGVAIDRDGALEIASRSRGTPRIANRFLKRARDFAQLQNEGMITAAVADHALKMLDVDELGLDRIDRRLMTAILTNFGGGPVGLDTLAAFVGEDSNTIEDVYEPYLLQLGFLNRTPRGRMATAEAARYFGIEGAQLSF